MAEIVEEAKKDACLSDTPSHKLLRRLFAYGKGREDMSFTTADWIKEFPDLQRLLEECQKNHEIRLYPSAIGTEGVQDLTFDPSTLALLKNTPKSPPHRQVTVDGQHIDVRSLVAAVLTTPHIENFADACRIWLAELGWETPRAVCKIRINLHRAIGMRGAELAAFDPVLKAEIVKALATRPVNNEDQTQKNRN
jgi:hypothetical protein